MTHLTIYKLKLRRLTDNSHTTTDRDTICDPFVHRNTPTSGHLLCTDGSQVQWEGLPSVKLRTERTTLVHSKYFVKGTSGITSVCLVPGP